MDRIQAMQTFIAVVDEGSFTKAAERLAISPQLVSKYVAQLEQHLGIRILNRTTRRLHLTEAGMQYYQRAQQVLSDIADMESELSDLQTQARGTLRINAPVSFATHHLAPVISQFQLQHPAVHIDLQLNDRKVDIVEEGFDIALRIGRLQDSSLIAKRICPIQMGYFAAPEYLKRQGTPQTLQALEQHRFLRYTYLDNISEPKIPNSGSSLSVELNNSLVSNNGDVLVAAAIEGAGIVLQPTFITAEAVRSGKLCPILSEYRPQPVALYAMYAHRQLLASKVRSFIDFIDGYFGDPPYWDQ